MGLIKAIKNLLNPAVEEEIAQEKTEKLLKYLEDGNELIQIIVEGQVDLCKELHRFYNNGEFAEAFVYAKEIKGYNAYFINIFSEQLARAEYLRMNAKAEYLLDKTLNKIWCGAVNRVHDLIHLLEHIQKSALDEKVKLHARILKEAWEEIIKQHLKWR